MCHYITLNTAIRMPSNQHCHYIKMKYPRSYIERKTEDRIKKPKILGKHPSSGNTPSNP